MAIKSAVIFQVYWFNLTVLLVIVKVVLCEKIKLEFNCNDLHVLYDESKNFVNLRRIYDNLLRKNDVTLSKNEIGYDFFKTKPLEFNVSELYLQAEIYTQTASLFYDQIKYKDFDKDIPELFQNYSYCFINPKTIPKYQNQTNNKYRSIDGSGNNMKYPKVGASFTAYSRLIQAHYDDKIHSVRKSIRGYNLPSPRNIVRKLFTRDNENLNKFQNRTKIPTMASLMIGQYIAHDIGAKQTNQYIDGGDEGIRCCANFNKIHLPTTLTNSACLPITISKSDPFYSSRNIKCMGFVRSHMISNNPYRIDVGEQANTVTSFLDHSTIYGSVHKISLKVRSFNGGRLKTNNNNVLPVENGTYFSGDDRLNQTPFLAIWHSIFIRNHNMLADKLAIINPHWDDEKLFQEARRINIAIYQKIIYEEWLPIFLGKDYCKKYGLKCDCNSLYCEHHNYDVDASAFNEFSAGGFRYFHSFINSKFELYDADMELTESFNLSDIVQKPRLLEHHYDDIIRGFLKQKINLIGYSTEILNKFFKNNQGIGIDLLSIDIVRGRDHGIPAYYKFRKMCRMPQNIQVFNDLYPEVPLKIIKQLRQTYKSVYDVDLLVGGALESILRNETDDENDAPYFGPTLQCIIGEQFYRLKMGDSYFYTNPKSPHKFTPEQLKQIKSYTIARLFCETTNIEHVQRNAFLEVSDDNEMLNCYKYPAFNLELWREV